MGRIAVFTDENGNLANFYQCAQIKIFEKEKQIFQLRDEINYEKIKPISPIEIRRKTQDLLYFLNECKTVAFKEILGIPYSIFDKAGCNIFSIQDYSLEQLDEIEKDIMVLQEEQNRRKEMESHWLPVELDTPGIYFFDLMQAQEKYPEITSKKALKPFLDTVPFLELRFVCAHIPPWLEKDRRFKVKTEKNGKALYSVITLRQC